MIATALLQDAETQPVSASFFGAITIAYLVICALWLLLDRLARGGAWPKPALPATDRPWRELGVAVLVTAGILGMGQVWRAGWLIPKSAAPPLLVYQLNTLLIWAPLWLALLWRRAPLGSILLWPARAGRKALVGAALGAVGVVVYCAVRGELDRLGAIAAGCFGAHELAHFLPVFLEGVGVAFLYVRLRWVVGPLPALLLPCLLFALSHVPRQVESQRTGAEIAAFFALNTLLPLVIFATVVRSRDVIWIGVAHYVLDVAIDAF